MVRHAYVGKGVSTGLSIWKRNQNDLCFVLGNKGKELQGNITPTTKHT